MKRVVAAGVLALSLMLTGCSDVETTDASLELDTANRPSATDRARDRFEGAEELDGLHVITDTVTGVQYLFVTDWSWSDGLAGGLTVLVDADGKPLVDKETSDA